MDIMAPFANLSREEKIGLGVAGAAHVALAMALMMQDTANMDYTPPQRIDVSLATEISLESTAPDPASDPAAAMAPVIADTPAAEPLPQVEVSEPQPLPDPPKPPPVQRNTQQRTERAVRPTPTPTPTPAPPVERSRPDRQQSQQASGSRLNDTFLEGMSDSTGDQGSPADRPNAQQQASIDGAIIRQLKPHWTPPSGVEVERLVSVVRFRLNRDGSLRGNPEVLRQTGVTDANRAQAGRHQEQAIRAVRLAAPFNLPERFYSGWSVVTSNFDNRLAQ